jgi:hypothetical protein
MQLKLQRSQRMGGLTGKTAVFALDARIHLKNEERDSVQRYKLGGQVIYNSQASRRHLDAAKAAGSQGTTGGYVKSLASVAMAAMNLNITIDSLQRGQHIECKDLDELLSAEDELMDACNRLKSYLDTAATFDGREMIFEFNGREPVASVNPLPPLPPAAMPASAEPLISQTDSAPAEPVVAQPSPSPALNTEHVSQGTKSASFDDYLARVNYFWNTRTKKQKIILVIVGLLALYILSRIL